MLVQLRVRLLESIKLPDSITNGISYHQDPDSDDMSSFFPCEIDGAIRYINLGYGAQAPKIVIL